MPEVEIEPSGEAIAAEVKRILALREATRLIAEQDALEAMGDIEWSTAKQLSEEPLNEDEWRIKGLWRRHQMALCFAEAKAGKTTLAHNIIRSLVTGELFLGARTVTPIGPDETIVMCDLELDREYLKQELHGAGITDERVIFYHLVGNAAAIDVTVAESRTKFAEMLRAVNCKVLFIDPIGALLQARGVSENDNTEVGRILRLFETLGKEAGVDELFIVHHKGKAEETQKHGRSERTSGRGASAFSDVPGSLWDYEVMTNHEGLRHLKVKGRLPKRSTFNVKFDETTHHLYADEALVIKTAFKVNKQEVGNNG